MGNTEVYEKVGVTERGEEGVEAIIITTQKTITRHFKTSNKSQIKEITSLIPLRCVKVQVTSIEDGRWEMITRVDLSKIKDNDVNRQSTYRTKKKY